MIASRAESKTCDVGGEIDSAHGARLAGAASLNENAGMAADLLAADDKQQVR